MAQRTFQHLEMVRRILLKRLQKYNARIYLFGSMARGEVRRTSDIDIAVLPVGNLPDGVFGQIREDLENSRVPYRVELIETLPRHLPVFPRMFRRWESRGTAERKIGCSPESFDDSSGEIRLSK
jgi:uncharacterized protein